MMMIANVKTNAENVNIKIASVNAIAENVITIMMIVDVMIDVKNVITTMMIVDVMINVKNVITTMMIADVMMIDVMIVEKEIADAT